MSLTQPAFELYFVAAVLSDQIAYLAAGPFVDYSDAYAWRNERVRKQYRIVKTTLPFSVEEVAEPFCEPPDRC